MSFSLIPSHLKDHTINFIQPSKVTTVEIKKCAAQITIISSVNKELKAICLEKIADLRRINELVNKYNAYNRLYENPPIDNFTNQAIDPRGNPQLLDALFTGYMKHHPDYTPESEKDIKDLVKLTPQSLHCILGSLRCREEVTPLYMACLNVKIPLHIVEFLLQNGADPNATLLVTTRRTSILTDLACALDDKRFDSIKALFDKFKGS